MPKISVIIPTYNRPEFLEKAIRSVLSQSFQDFELLIVHNGPHGGLREIVKNFSDKDTRVKYFYTPTADAVLARNEGVRNAQGTWIAFLDDDDEWFPQKLERQMEFVDKNPQVGIVSCRVSIFENGKEILDPRAVFWGVMTFRKLVFLGCLIYSLSCVLIKKECFNRLGIFNPNFLIANDYDFYLRCVQHYSAYSLEEKLVRYRRHPSNLTQNVIQTCSESIEVLRRLKLVSPNAFAKKIIRLAVFKRSKVFCNLGSDAKEAKNYTLAIKYFSYALRRNPFIGIHIKWGRMRNVGYRFLRPYVALAFCCLASFIKSFRGQSSTNERI